MEVLLQEIARYVALAIQAIAIVVVVIGVAGACAGVVRLVTGTGVSDADRRDVWLHLARWLVAALTFQLAADIVQTTVAPTWDEIGRVAAVAAIRTFLTYFLDRDLEAVQVREAVTSGESQDAKRA